jgi:hypothetical protein
MVDLRVVGGEGVLLDQVAGKPGQAVAFAVTVKVRSKDRPEASIGVGGSAAHPVLYADDSPCGTPAGKTTESR